MTLRCALGFGLAPALVGTLGACASGCNSAAAASRSAQPAVPVAPAPPPQDDGQSAKGGTGGGNHAAALEQLKRGPLGWADDRQQSLRVPLPDAPHWLRVKFWGAPSLVAFRYGKAHHAVVGGVVVHVPDENAPGACSKAFEQAALPMADAFEVAIAYDPPAAVTWREKIIDLDALVATTATLGVRDEYAVAYATYPAWSGACLALGVAVPVRGELERAKAVRDRFMSEVLPKVEITARVEPKERY